MDYLVLNFLLQNWTAVPDFHAENYNYYLCRTFFKNCLKNCLILEIKINKN